MKIEIVTNEKDNIEFFMEGERHTMPALLKERLSSKENVEFVAYRLDHPLDTKAKFILKAKNAKKVLEDATKELSKELEDFRKAFEKAK